MAMKNSKIPVFAMRLVMACIVLGPLGQFFMKTGMNQLGRIESISALLSPSVIMQILKSPYVVCGLVLYMISAFLWLGALSTLEMSFTYPLLSLSYVLTTFLAFLYMEEPLSPVRGGGIILVVIGCFFITKSGQDKALT
jgi:drug/metabolite transporter (DMT)-like permease